jgi:hypothetical protein
LAFCHYTVWRFSKTEGTMAALHRGKIIATLRKLTRAAKRSASPSTGPGCTCESCVQAWGRHRPVEASSGRELRRLRPGLY